MRGRESPPLDWLTRGQRELAAQMRRELAVDRPKILVGIADDRERARTASIAADAVAEFAPVVVSAGDPAAAFEHATDLWAAVIDTDWLANPAVDLVGRIERTSPHAEIVGYTRTGARVPAARWPRYCVERRTLAKRLTRIVGEIFEYLETLPARRLREDMGARIFYRFGPEAALSCGYAVPELQPPPSADQSERDRIEWALLQARGNISAAAKRLGWDRARLNRRMKALGVAIPTDADASQRMRALAAPLSGATTSVQDWITRDPTDDET